SNSLLRGRNEEHARQEECYHMEDSVGRHYAEVNLHRVLVRSAEQECRTQPGWCTERVAGGDVEREEPEGYDAGSDQAGDETLREERVTPESRPPERMLIPCGPVQVVHEDEPRQHVRSDDVRPRH